MRFPSFLIVLALLLFNSCATAQRGKGEISKKEQKILTAAKGNLERGQLREAVAGFDELIALNSNEKDYHFLQSLALREQFRYAEAAAAIQKGISVSDKPSARSYRELGQMLSYAGDFSAAKKAYQTYNDLSRQSGRTTTIEQATADLAKATYADSLASNPVPFSPSPVPGLVNTKESFEYHPAISTDGERLLFTRRVNREQEDFYYAELTTDGSWGEGKPLPGINTSFDEGAQSISADGTYMVYTSCNMPEQNQDCDLYESYLKDGRWTKGRSLKGAGINTQYYEAQSSLSRDGRYLIFASKRPGGKGGADLYLSGRLPDGEWSPPIPVNKLNTKGDEQYPFWAADGRTIYFTSNGLPGLGGDDLYFSRLQDDNSFSKPQNLGFPINTAENETNMFIPLSAEIAYYSKRYYDLEAEKLQIDLFQFPLPSHLRPRPATYVRARVTARKTGEPLEATVRVQALATDLPATVQTTDAEGQFLTVLAAGNDYAFTVDKPGYLFASERFELKKGTPESPYLVDIKLDRISETTRVETPETDGSIAFKNVLFTSGSAELLNISFNELNRLADILTNNPDLSVTITGHTDDVGDEASNLSLSQIRAASVKAFLERQGIAAARITTEGYGESRPIDTNDTPEGRAKNRRTTFRLYL